VHGAQYEKLWLRTLVYLAGFIAGSTTDPLATIGLSLLYYDERVLDASPPPVESALQIAVTQTVEVPAETMESPLHGIVL